MHLRVDRLPSPCQVLGSFLSLMHAVASITLDPAVSTPQRSAAKYLPLLYDLASRCMAAAASLPADKHKQVQHVRYDELVSDPVALACRIMEHVGETCDDAVTRRALEEYHADNKQGKHGAHRYRLADYGVERSDVERELAPLRAFMTRMLGEA